MTPPLQSRFEALQAYIKTPGFKRLFRYSTVSAISTVISLTGLYVFFRVLKVGSAAESNVIATAIATVPSYYLNRTWAWGRSGRSHLMREVVPFWMIAFASLVLSTIVVGVTAHEAHHLTHSHFGVTVLIELANLCTYGALWVGKFALFNKLLFAKDHSAPKDPQTMDEAVPVLTDRGDAAPVGASLRGDPLSG